MGELPAGYQIPKIKVSEPHLSASAVVSRIIDGQDEILLGHRVSEMPSFPDFWTFPGGGISKVDKHLQSHNEAMEILKQIQQNDKKNK